MAASSEGTGPEPIPVQYCSLHQQEVGYRTAGEGPVVVLLHGIAGSSESWLPVMERLAPRYRVVAPDFLGHGTSAKPATDYSLGNYASGVRDLLEVLGIDRATVVGHSFGGGVAMQFAYQFPEYCERLVLEDAGGLGREVSLLLRAATLPGSELVMPVLFPGPVRDLGDAVVRLADRFGFRNGHLAEGWRSYRSLGDAESRQAFVRTLRSVIDPGGQSVSALDRLYLAVHMPTMIIWGERDRMIPVSHAHAAHEALPNSRLELIPGVGHFPHAEQPDRFCELIESFLDTTEPSAIDPTAMRELLRQGSKRAG